MEEFITIAIFLFIGYLIIGSLFGTSSANKQNEQKDMQLSQKIRTLTPISASIILKRGEIAYFEDASTYSEVRVERRRQSAFIGKSLAGKNRSRTFFGGSSGSSKGVDVLTEIDSGSLILTNKRLYFDGSIRNKNIKLNSIMSIEAIDNFFSANQIEISVENRSKSLYFSTAHPHSLIKMIKLALSN